ncbi:hypothetical protein ACFKIX_000453 [Vibrio alginolyticus]
MPKNIPKDDPYLQNQAVDEEIEQFLNEDTTERELDDIDREIDEFLESDTTDHHSPEEIDQELDTFFENEQLSPWKAVQGSGENVHIGIDTEYVYNEEENRNDILSYQYYLIVGDQVMYDVELTPVAEVIKKSRVAQKSREDELKAINKVKNPRKSFDKYLVQILEAVLGRGLIKEWPKNIYIYAHFLRADIASFDAFWDIGKGKLEVIRNTVASTRGAYGIDLNAVGRSKQRMEPVHLTDKNRKKRESSVRFVDTMLLSPGKSGGLDSVGELIGIPKETIPEPYRKDRMDELLVADEALFCRYALRDAEITVKYGLEMQQFALEEMASETGIKFKQLPSTLGNFSVSLFRSLVGDKAALNEALGMETRQSQYWHAGKGQVITRTETN